MKTRTAVILIVLLLAGVGAAVYQPVVAYWKLRNQPKWRLAETTEGTLVAVVNSTGTIKPVLSVRIGSFVSGPIQELYVNFNEEVTKDQLLAKIDPRIYDAAVARDTAFLLTAKAEVARANAQLQQARNNEARAVALNEEDEDFVSDMELDQLRFSRMAQEAALQAAEASVAQAQASLDNSTANRNYTEIRSPVDGVIIDRKIDPGQTLAAQFQTPELFVVAPDMRNKMHVYASVDEADIGLIRNAQEKGQPVHFTVDAYPDDLFEGTIEEIRFSSTETQNVVTYPVVVAAPNPDLKLLPGMTAAISFRVDERPAVVKIPNAALRFYPDVKHVRKEDQKLLEGTNWEKEEAKESVNVLSAEEKAEARQKQNRRHVWLVEGDKLRALEVTVGLSDSKFTELVEGNLPAGTKLVTGIEPKAVFGK